MPRLIEGGLSKLSAEPNAKKTWFFLLSTSAFCFSCLLCLRVGSHKYADYRNRIILTRVSSACSLVRTRLFEALQIHSPRFFARLQRSQARSQYASWGRACGLADIGWHTRGLVSNSLPCLSPFKVLRYFQL